MENSQDVVCSIQLLDCQICFLQMLTFHRFNAQPLLNFRKQPEERPWEHKLPSAN